MTSKYNKSKHCLVEQNHLPPPQGNDLQYSRDFSKHVQSLRAIPCQPGTIWEEDKLYEEGKDYVIKGADEWKWCYQLHGKIFAAPIPKEDDLWMEIAVKFRLIYTDELELELIQKLSQTYTITKKTV